MTDTKEPKSLQKSRNELRSTIFDSARSKPKVIEFDFNGVDLEWREPSIRTMQDLRDDLSEDKNYMVVLLITFTYIAGTDERIFDDADYDSLCNMPFSGAFQSASSKIAKILNLAGEVDEQVKN